MLVETFSHKIIDLTDIKAGDITLEDVVGGLANINRFNGRHNEYSSPITVLQHSYAMYLYVKHMQPDNKELAIACLIHDAPEAYTGDILAPIKEQLPLIGEIERNIFKALAGTYLLPTDFSNDVHLIDALACFVEWSSFVAPNQKVCEQNLVPFGLDKVCKFATILYCFQMRKALDEARLLPKQTLVLEVLGILDKFYDESTV